MGRIAQLFCRHAYEAVEHVHDPSIDTYELRCEKCGRRKRVARGEHEAVGSHDIAMDRRPQLPRR